MNKQKTQMKPDEAAASLALATHISGQLMPQAPQGQEQSQQDQPQETPQNAMEQQGPQDNGTIDEYAKKFDELEKMVGGLKNEMKGAIDNLTNSVNEALKNEQE